MRLKILRKNLKRTIYVSGELRLLQMILERDIERCANEKDGGHETV